MDRKRKVITLDSFLVKRNKDEGTPDFEPTNSEAINMSLKENKGQTGVLDYPEIRTAEMWKEKKRTYPWLICKKGKLGCSIFFQSGQSACNKSRRP